MLLVNYMVDYKYCILFIAVFISVGYIARLLLSSSRLKSAINKNKVIPFYQLIVDSQSQTAFGVEILARRILPSGEMIMPEKFIPIAERKNLIVPMTVSLMEQVVAELEPYLHSLPRPFHICFNVNASCFHSHVFLRQCHLFLSSFRGAGVVLALEITEREKIRSTEALGEILSLLQERGIVIILDDFFSGYSNIKLLNDLTVDYLKIDKYFIKGAGDSACENILLDSLINMANRFGIEIIAEGVESQPQLDYLRGKKVQLVQGYYYTAPVSINEFAESTRRVIKND